ncbi:hypothetical protein OC846_001328 [Tilletia horrida]|uniref:F-box domain-containing protein n=1 Tax=Tilletia horrida TaxID=155126 RepID=A0AAN6GSX6_9BASI|nr:hypothetical protein OC846_001328 [Tilletia horrida]
MHTDSRSLMDRPFLGLPVELLQYLFEFVRHQDLPACCQVSKLFHTLAAPVLYRRLWLRDQIRLKKVFTVLGTRPHLAALLRVVEIRVFPFGLAAEALEALEISIIRTFQAAVNLEELIWTRTGSFLPRTGFQRSRNDRVLRTIFDRIKRLRLLELTGDSRSWSPDLLIAKMPANIERLSLVMPDRTVSDRLPMIAERIGSELHSLSILSNNATFIRDAYLEASVPFLENLTRLSLVGCKNITGTVVAAVLKRCESKMTELSLEGLNLMPEEVDLLCKLTPKLRTLAITHPSRSIPAAPFYESLSRWIEQSHQLTRFTLYRMSGDVAAPDEEQLQQDDNDEQETEQTEQTPPPAPIVPTTAVQEPAMEVQSQENETSAPPANEARASDSQAPEGGEALLPFSSLHINSLHLQRYRPTASEPGSRINPFAGMTLGQPSDPLLSSLLIKKLVQSRGDQLVQLRIHRLAMSLDQLGLICDGCPRLEDLVVHLFEPDIDLIRSHLSRLGHLRSVHILASLRCGLETTERDLLTIAQSCAGTLRQIGFRNRVWEVVANVGLEAKSEATTAPPDVSKRSVSLRRWDASQGNWPEAFLVVRV